MGYKVKILSYFTPPGARHIEYKMHVIHTTDKSWGVIKISARYSKLLELHNMIYNAVKNLHQIPPFPKKKVVGNKARDFIKERGVALERYLRGLLKYLPGSGYVKELEIVSNFLGINKHEAEQFRRQKKQDEEEKRRLKRTRDVFEKFDVEKKDELGPSETLNILRAGYEPTYIDRYSCLKQFGSNTTDEDMDKCWVSRRAYIVTMQRIDPTKTKEKLS
ncbi:hypothetical protein AAMO2058_001737500, partial [Amorphochlora amoebiformis]